MREGVAPPKPHTSRSAISQKGQNTKLEAVFQALEGVKMAQNPLNCVSQNAMAKSLRQKEHRRNSGQKSWGLESPPPSGGLMGAASS